MITYWQGYKIDITPSGRIGLVTGCSICANPCADLRETFGGGSLTS